MKKAASISIQIITLLFTFLVVSLLAGRHYSRMFISLSSISNTNTISHNQAITQGKLNINTASAEDLTQLPGIGEVIAQRIVEYRQERGPYLSIDDLIQIKGIGEARLDAIKNYITIGD